MYSQATSKAQKTVANPEYDQILSNVSDAIYHGDINKVKDLLDQDPSIQNYISQKILWGREIKSSVWVTRIPPLHAAADRGNCAMVKLLIHDYDFQLDAREIFTTGLSMTPLHEAICCEKIDMVELLLGLGADASLGGKWRRKTFKDALELVKILQAEDDSDQDELKKIEDLLRKPKDTKGRYQTRTELFHTSGSCSV